MKIKKEISFDALIIALAIVIVGIFLCRIIDLLRLDLVAVIFQK